MAGHITLNLGFICTADVLHCEDDYHKGWENKSYWKQMLQTTSEGECVHICICKRGKMIGHACSHVQGFQRYEQYD